MPVLAGKSLAEAAAALGAAGFTVGTVTEVAADRAPGTVVEPATTRFVLAPSAIDLVISVGTAAPQTRLVLSVAGAKRIALRKPTTIAVRIKVSEAGAGDGDASQREEVARSSAAQTWSAPAVKPGTRRRSGCVSRGRTVRRARAPIQS